MDAQALLCRNRNTGTEDGGNQFGPKAQDRSRLLDLLNERLRFETMLSRLSTTFINLPAEEVDSQIERGLQQIVEFLDVERSSLGQFSADGSELIVTHSYTIPGFAPTPRLNLAAALPWYTARLWGGEVLRFTRLPEELPPEAANEREYSLRDGIRSHLLIPFRVGEAILGGLGFGSLRQQRDWPDDLVQSLQLVGEIFANALARKRAEEESRSLRLQLARVARVTLMGELVASIAHEVNQPLCAIVTNAQALQRMLAVGGFPVAELHEALQDVAQDSQRASAVLARIRGLLKKAPVERAPVDVNDLLREMAVLMRGELVRRGIVLQLELAENLPAVVGDRIQLQQVVLNLLLNGAEALEDVAEEVRELVLRSTADGTGAVTVLVVDSGVGLDPAIIDQIFDALFTTKPGGMGMGLAICQSIIQAHGGRISASPNAGSGATFQCILPGLPGGPS